MTSITQIALAGLVMVGLPTAAIMSGPVDQDSPDVIPASQARFVNNTTGAATVFANGSAVWTDIATGQTSEWADISDTTVTFRMVSAGSEDDTASVTQKMESGARYTLTGRTAMGKLELTIAKED